MGIKLLLNDYYDLLKLMHDNEAIILDEKVIRKLIACLVCFKKKVLSNKKHGASTF